VIRPVMPVQEQGRQCWRLARWVIWPPDTPVWGQFVYKIAQAVFLIGVVLGSVPISAAGLCLTVAVALMTGP
jgi:hypothetical protein